MPPRAVTALAFASLQLVACAATTAGSGTVAPAPLAGAQAEAGLRRYRAHYADPTKLVPLDPARSTPASLRFQPDGAPTSDTQADAEQASHLRVANEALAAKLPACIESSGPGAVRVPLLLWVTARRGSIHLRPPEGLEVEPRLIACVRSALATAMEPAVLPGGFGVYIGQSGSLPMQHIADVIRGDMDGVRRCHTELVRAVGEVAGRAVVRFQIDTDGAVRASEAVVDGGTGGGQAPPATGPSLRARALRSLSVCIALGATQWTFDAPDGGGPAVVTYPFAFELRHAVVDEGLR